MKTKSIKSIAALLGIGVALNLSALAGPGPQSEPRGRKSGDGKAVIAEQVRPATSTTKQVKKVVLITGPRGTAFGYVR